MTSTDLCSTLRSRLLAAELDFLSDDVDLQTFTSKWDTLCGDYKEAVRLGVIDDSLKELACSIFLKMAILGDHLEQVQKEAKVLTTSFSTEIEDVLSRMSISDVMDSIPSPMPASDTSPTHQSARVAVPSTNASSSTLPPFIAPAYDWVIGNLDNPYPSNSLKISIASEACVAPRTVKDWFQSIRRHIGWGTLCRKHFQGSRSLAVAAAKIFFSHKNADTSLPLNIVAAFLSMKEKLDGIYLEERGLQLSTSSHSRSNEVAPKLLLSISPPHPQVHIASSFTSWSTESPESSPPSSPMRAPSLVAESISSDSDDDDQLQEFPSQSPLGNVSAWSTDNFSGFETAPENERPVKQQRYVSLHFEDLFFLP
jgi:hypothetical protein